jgi:hypothetical protein
MGRVFGGQGETATGKKLFARKLMAYATGVSLH